MNFKNFLFIILHGICSTTEQILFKRGANNLEEHKLKTAKDYLLFILKVLKTPVIWVAFIMTALAWLIWFVVLANVDLSVAIPVDSMQYIMILIASCLFLKERIDRLRIAGTLLILLGVLFVALS
jgi:drug/metabolite transporter (DMT)-like permease